MKIKVSAIALTTLFISINGMAQSDYVSDMSSAYYQQWYTDYEQTGIKINDISTYKDVVIKYNLKFCYVRYQETLVKLILCKVYL